MIERVAGRYGCHDLLRTYARQLATAEDRPGSRRAAQHRMLDHYLHTADRAAANLGLSRNEYLRRKFEEGTRPTGERAVTAEDWQRSAEVFADLAHPTVMDAAWR